MSSLSWLLISPIPARGQDAACSFHDTLAAAWAHLPQRQELAARSHVAAARLRAGSAWLPDAPTATGSYINDRAIGSNQGYITSQVEVSTPVWLPGEGTAMQQTARAEGHAADAAVDATHLELAAQLLDLAVQAEQADSSLQNAARRQSAALALARDMARRVAVGESAQSDLLAADADEANASVAYSNALAARAAARAALAAVTGSETPCSLAATPPTQIGADEEVLAHHPRLVAAEKAVAASDANEQLVRLQNRDDPQIGLQAINEKQPGTRWDTRVGVVFHFSFATEARNAPKRAQAELATTQAIVQREMTRREVVEGLAQARAMLAAAERSLTASDRAAAALQRRSEQIDRAWRLGEMPLIEVVRAHGAAFDAAYARDKARTDLNAARLKMTLAEGVLP